MKLNQVMNNNMKNIITWVCTCFLFAMNLIGQEGEFPIIKQNGEAFFTPKAVETPDNMKEYQVLFDITKTAGNKEKINPGLEHIARFINVYGLYDVPLSNMNIAAIIHGDAIEIATNHEGHTDNQKLIEALMKNGVQFYVCSQSLFHNNYIPDDVNKNMIIAASAMNVLVDFQIKNFQILYY